LNRDTGSEIERLGVAFDDSEDFVAAGEFGEHGNVQPDVLQSKSKDLLDQGVA
jgi:hypothetical protein